MCIFPPAPLISVFFNNSNDPNKPKPSFGFGSNPATPSQNTTTPQTNLNTTTPASAPSTAFGGPSTASTTPASTTAFGFGSKPAETTTPASKTGFGFGGGGSTTPFGAPQQPTEKPAEIKPTFEFGMQI